MSQTKAQKAAAERAKKSAAPQPATAEQPKAEVKPAAAASKQMQTIEKLKEGWTAKGVDLSKLSIKDDGKFKLVIVDKGWPTVQIGPTGGITVKELKSYTSAFEASMNGLALYEKQQQREQRKVAAAAPVPAAKAPAAEKQAVSA
jgi:predicted methyltransferase